MQRSEFVHAATAALELLDEQLGDLEDDRLDVDLGGDVLTLAFADGGKFIINAHSAALQIWMAAGTTAWHFDPPDSARPEWIAAKSGDELFSTVARVVGERLGQELELGPSPTS